MVFTVKKYKVLEPHFICNYPQGPLHVHLQMYSEPLSVRRVKGALNFQKEFEYTYDERHMSVNLSNKHRKNLRNHMQEG